MRRSKVYLIGMPGSGKSTLGKALAAKLGWSFTDLDEFVVAREGLAIPEIFRLRGEEVFRMAEREALLKLSAASENMVIATGGGAPCFFDNIDQMIATGITIYLDVPMDELCRRLDAGKKSRPLLADANAETLDARMKRLDETRRPFYSRAALSIRGTALTAGDLIQLMEFATGAEGRV